jgi:hypothetical protein
MVVAEMGIVVLVKITLIVRRIALVLRPKLALITRANAALAFSMAAPILWIVQLIALPLKFVAPALAKPPLATVIVIVMTAIAALLILATTLALVQLTAIIVL